MGLTTEIQPESCRECGAAQLDGVSCYEQCGWLDGGESEDPELASPHLFAVACYNLQHPAQFNEAGLRRALSEH